MNQVLGALVPRFRVFCLERPPEGSRVLAYFFPERMRVGARMEERSVQDSEYAKVRGKRG